MFIRESNSCSTNYFVTNRVKQGGILSPSLFNAYMNRYTVLQMYKVAYLNLIVLQCIATGLTVYCYINEKNWKLSTPMLSGRY